MPVHLPAVSREKIRTTVTTSADPTGAAPAFAVVAEGTDPVSDDYTGNTGEWVDSYGDTGTGRVIAATPLIGDSSATITVAAGAYDMWIKWTVGLEEPEKLFDQLIVF